MFLVITFINTYYTVAYHAKGWYRVCIVMSSGRIPAAGRLVLVSGESAARADSPQSGAGRRSGETLQPSHYLTSPPHT